MIGFERVTLDAGETRKVTVSLTAQQQADRHLFQVWSEDSGSWVNVEGEVGVKVGGASNQLTAPVHFSFKGTTTPPSPEPSEQPTPEPTPDPSTDPTPEPEVDIYTTPGYHNVNGRQWITWCEPYSQTHRCYTNIWATQIHRSGDQFFQTNGWAFNTLTYAASPRELWADNPLGNTGEWIGADGREWRTECDTPATGRNGCRTYALTSVNERTDTGYATVKKWVVNNLVRFS